MAMCHLSTEFCENWWSSFCTILLNLANVEINADENITSSVEVIKAITQQNMSPHCNNSITDKLNIYKAAEDLLGIAFIQRSNTDLLKAESFINYCHRHLAYIFYNMVGCKICDQS